jgi:hypothetical protein
METILKWASKYSLPVLVLICLGAGLIYLLKFTTEQVIEAEFNRRAKEIEVALERRSTFEQQVLLDRYKLVANFAERLEKVSTDVNRLSQGKKVEGLVNQGELPSLTSIYEDLTANRFVLPDRFYSFFEHQAELILKMANAKTEEERNRFALEYISNYDKLLKLANDEFGTDKLSW